MIDICRICLKYNPDETMEVFDDDTDWLNKINYCLPFKILLHKSLPKRICKDCTGNVKLIISFQNQIKQNEDLLKQYYDNNTLSSFYKSLQESKLDRKENLYIVEEKVEKPIKCKKEILPLEENNDNLENCNLLFKGNIEIIKEDKERLNDDLQNIKDYKNLPMDTDEMNTIKTLFDDGKWECLMCNKVFEKRYDLRQHYKKHHIKDDGNKSIRNYLVNKSGKTEKYKCKQCDKEFTSKVRVNRHFVIHIDDRPFFCKICGRTYKEISEIMRHSKVHSRVKPLMCTHEGCGYTTAYYNALKVHAKKHFSDASNEFKYTCQTCGKGFDVKTSFDQHQNIHTGAKPYVCDVCQKAFHMAKYLKSHRDSMHPELCNQKRHLCVHCGVTCDNRTALNAHLKDHGLSQTFLCDICGKSFLKADHLKLHVKVHLDDKSYACSTCNKAFVKKSNLKLHERVHTGEKPHICSHCGKRFTQKSSLVIHTRNHLGTKPYKCSGCPKSFVCRNQLTRHLKGCT